VVELQKLAASGHAQARRTLEVPIDELAPVFARRYSDHRRRMSLRRKQSAKRVKKRAESQSDAAWHTPTSSTADRKAATISAALERARLRQGADK
jgi:hypothetical protein